MSTRRLASTLLRWFNATAEGVYLLDHENRIQFANTACLEWTRLKAEELIGQTCYFRSDAPSPDPTPAARAAVGLCPPPGAHDPDQQPFRVHVLDPQGVAHYREALCLSFRDETGESSGLLVMVNPNDVDANDPEADAAETNQVGTSAADTSAARTIAPRDPAASSPWPRSKDPQQRLHERLVRYRGQLRRQFHLGGFVGDSPQMLRVQNQARLATETFAHVLILGPEGSGRRQLARAIHHATQGAVPGTLIPLDAALLSPEALSSAWPPVAGMRPDPDPARVTLLLQDVEQLSSALQHILPRRLSEAKDTVRVIATAKEIPTEDLDEEAFSRPLASLLSTLVIELPPLADRLEDLPLLVQMLIEDANVDATHQLSGCSPRALDLLGAYPWQGDMHELSQAISEAHARATGSLLMPEDLAEKFTWGAEPAKAEALAPESIVLDEFLGQIERELITRALKASRGNKTKAAKALGLSRPRLYRRMVQLGFEEVLPDFQPLDQFDDLDLPDES
jgi:transcriptional regulator of acetoin/glycerol metabolism